MKLNLPSPGEKTPPAYTDPPLLIIFGKIKIGKTTVCSQLPNHLIVDFTGKETAELECTKIVVKTKQEYAELYKRREDLKQYDYLVLDNASAMEILWDEMGVDNHRATPKGRGWEGDSCVQMEYGLGYFYWRAMLRKYFLGLVGYAKHTILVAHVKDKFIDKPVVPIEAKSIALTGQNANIATQDASAVGYLYRSRAGSLHIDFQATDSLSCGARTPHLKGQKFPFCWGRIYTQDERLKEPLKE